eukprot:5820730-Ditylum_brightwellii.AAC.2
MVQFVMKSTLFNFREKFYVYKGAAKGKDLTANDVALAIRGYELAFLANLVAYYVFDMNVFWGQDFREFIKTMG